MSDKPITVRINMDDMLLPMSPRTWGAYVQGKLREAGVPLSKDGESLIRGSLRRFDDPKDWSITVWEWTPPVSSKRNDLL